MDFDIRYRIFYQRDPNLVFRRVQEGITRWDASSALTTHGKQLSILVTDDKDFAHTYKADVIVLVSDKVETVEQNTVVSRFEDVPDRLCEALQKLEHVHSH